MLCLKDHRYIPELSNLPDAQSGAGRHKCPGCAYELGYQDGLNHNIKALDINLLDDSQAGTGRHKDVYAAYALGYQDGLDKNPL